MPIKAMLAHQDDNPWRRLIWTLPAALAITIVLLWMLSWFAGKSAERLPEAAPVDAQLIEIPPPVAKMPPVPHHAKPVAQPKLASTPVRQVAPVQAPAPNLVKAPAPEEKTTVKSMAMPPAAPPAPPANEATGNSGAQVITHPMPQIPDDLRQDALSTVALARFHVSVDGTATVELVKPTQNPRLNRLLLETLKNWRFFPSMKDGKPVASTQELSIKVEVK